jgi:hypothetical protein
MSGARARLSVAKAVGPIPLLLSVISVVSVSSVSSVASMSSAASAASVARIYVTPTAAALVAQGLATAAPDGAAAAAFTDVPAPTIKYLPNVARATNVPWIDSNGWRFARGIGKARYATLPAGAAPLAAAEAFVYDIDAILNPDPADLDELTRMLRFLQPLQQPALPPLVNVGIVDDGTPVMGEVLNLLTRRNLFYKVVTAPDRALDLPDRALDLIVQLGTPDFPKASAANPYEFAARVRAKLGDDKRFVRLYGASTVLARLTGDRQRARLSLLAFDNRRQQAASAQNIRVRVRGRYKPARFAGYGAADGAALTDLRHPGDASEFWVPSFRICAVVDLEAIQ